MSHMKRYIMASQHEGRYLSLNEWRELERMRGYDETEMASFETYLAIAKKSLELFNKDDLYEDINQLQ